MTKKPRDSQMIGVRLKKRPDLSANKDYLKEIAKGFAEMAAEIIDVKIKEILAHNSIFNEFISHLPEADT